MSLQERFEMRFEKTDGCWLWTGYPGNHGYGTIKLKGKVLLAHRVAWELENGPISDDLTVDHLCANKLCVRVSHMELVSRSENSRREGVRARKPTCPKGHAEFTIRSNGKRSCRACQRDHYYVRKAGT